MSGKVQKHEEHVDPAKGKKQDHGGAYAKK